MNLRRIKPALSIREEAIAAGVSTTTIKKRRRARHAKREREYTARSAGMVNRVRDPETGALVSFVGQRVRRTRDPITGRFLVPTEPKSVPDSRVSDSTGERSSPKVATLSKPLEPTDAEIAELVARYPLQPLSSVLDASRIAQYEADARKVLDVIARRVLTLNASTPAGVLRMAIDAERYDLAMRIISGSERVGNPKKREEPRARELYDLALSFSLCDPLLTANRTRQLARELVRARLDLGIS